MRFGTFFFPSASLRICKPKMHGPSDLTSPDCEYYYMQVTNTHRPDLWRKGIVGLQCIEESDDDGRHLYESPGDYNGLKDSCSTLQSCPFLIFTTPAVSCVLIFPSVSASASDHLHYVSTPPNAYQLEVDSLVKNNAFQMPACRYDNYAMYY